MSDQPAYPGLALVSQSQQQKKQMQQQMQQKQMQQHYNALAASTAGLPVLNTANLIPLGSSSSSSSQQQQQHIHTIVPGSMMNALTSSSALSSSNSLPAAPNSMLALTVGSQGGDAVSGAMIPAPLNIPALMAPLKSFKYIPAFLNKLFCMVNDDGSNHLIHWTDDGINFIVTRHEEFAREVLPRFFKHKNFASFVRQLNMYGFHKIPHLQAGALVSTPGSENAEHWEFTNPFFRRDRPDLIVHVRRKSGKDHDKEQDKDADEDAMSEISNLPTPSASGEEEQNVVIARGGKAAASASSGASNYRGASGSSSSGRNKAVVAAPTSSSSLPTISIAGSSSGSLSSRQSSSSPAVTAAGAAGAAPSQASVSGIASAAAANAARAVDLKLFFNEIAAVKRQQQAITQDLLNFQRDNQNLWAELMASRARSQRQEETIEKIVRFLASFFSYDVNKKSISPKRQRLMIEPDPSISTRSAPASPLGAAILTDLSASTPQRASISTPSSSLSSMSPSSISKATIVAESATGQSESESESADPSQLLASAASHMNAASIGPSSSALSGISSSVHSSLSSVPETGSNPVFSSSLISHSTNSFVSSLSPATLRSIASAGNFGRPEMGSSVGGLSPANITSITPSPSSLALPVFPPSPQTGGEGTLEAGNATIESLPAVPQPSLDSSNISQIASAFEIIQNAANTNPEGLSAAFRSLSEAHGLASNAGAFQGITVSEHQPILSSAFPDISENTGDGSIPMESYLHLLPMLTENQDDGNKSEEYKMQEIANLNANIENLERNLQTLQSTIGFDHDDRLDSTFMEHLHEFLINSGHSDMDLGLDQSGDMGK